MYKLMFYMVFLILFLPGNSFGEQKFLVERVSDGDTIVLKNGWRIRYIGINAPEIAHKRRKAEPYGLKARKYNEKLVLLKYVRLEFDKERYDRYGRLLSYVFLENGLFVNAKMIEEGYAYVLPHRPCNKYDSLLLEWQRKAMSARKGMWREWKKKDGFYIGNRNSKRFHHDFCPFGKKISKRNRRMFSTRWDAFYHGFAPCKKCTRSR